MKVVTEIGEYRKLRKGMPSPVGFVPTMGYLHQGHLALVQQARAENKTVVVSIFVNPTQFGPKDDLAAYPRDPERDLALLEKEGTDIVFMPSAEEMYPEGFSSWVEVDKVTDRLEGAFRPGHFRGVATIVAKLFNSVQPHRAYFGQKDAQQLIVIKKMVSDLNMDLEVVAVPTVRDPDGLAMSSRNTYLDPEERKAALVLWNALSLAQELWSKGERNAERLRQEMSALIQKEPRAKIDYVSVADPDSLEELSQIEGTALVSMAVRIGKTRLIDNITLG
ncbi:MAG: pantoate--beta-alanine ligase [Dehalococcoidia bacterium]|nr:pantoate--beta-alanine ligase [Chloroflexota bacterium]MCK4242261.1 pantoate--beta-alanine ligase [Dehalococcoidia bacterium]